MSPKIAVPVKFLIAARFKKLFINGVVPEVHIKNTDQFALKNNPPLSDMDKHLTPPVIPALFNLKVVIQPDLKVDIVN